jgi:hypothetical protein
VTPVPAAVANARRGHALGDLQGRLHGFLERSGRTNGERLAGRLLPAPAFEISDISENPSVSETREGAFHWLLIPEWLAESFALSSTSTASGRTILDDLCWIQFCVFGLFRAQDDLVDGEVRDPLLAVEANQLLVEAALCAARHFEGDSPFWGVFRETIDATSRAIVELDRLQRSPERDGETELDLYVDLAACLKIAAAGVAFASGRDHVWRTAISPALDRLAVAGQILDDVHDIQDDLGAGRINYAAWYLGRPVFGSTPEAIEAVVASNLATTDRLADLMAETRGRVEQSARLLNPAICSRSHAYLLDYGRGIDALGRQLESRRRTLFEAADRAA